MLAKNGTVCYKAKKLATQNIDASSEGNKSYENVDLGRKYNLLLQNY